MSTNRLTRKSVLEKVHLSQKPQAMPDVATTVCVVSRQCYKAGVVSNLHEAEYRSKLRLVSKDSGTSLLELENSTCKVIFQNITPKYAYTVVANEILYPTLKRSHKTVFKLLLNFMCSISIQVQM